MSPKFISLEIIFVYFLLLIPWPSSHVVKLLCPKDNSRLVRKIIRSKWTPILDKYQVKFPLECPLHPFRDLFAPRQDAKQRDRPTQWTCRLCGKSFYQEKFLDQHFEARHKTVINEAEDAICLADFCDIMRCDVFQTEESSSLKTSDQHIVTEIEVWGDSFGQNSAIAKVNKAYLNLIPLRTPAIGASRATKVQNRQLCQDKIGQSNLKRNVENANENGEKSRIKPEVGSLMMKGSTSGSVDKHSAQPLSTSTPTVATTTTPSTATHTLQPSVLTPGSGSSRPHTAAAPASASPNMDIPRGGQTVQSTAPKDERNQSDTNKGSNGNEQSNRTVRDKNGQHMDTNTTNNNNATQNGTQSQKIRANCKPEELAKLRAKCEQLVRSCIGGLLLSMADQSFHKMEEELNRAVCWYLTCERYWEDGPLESRAFPWLLILILVLVLSTGICFCYYIIWILFDSEETTINANNHHHHHIYMPPGQTGYEPYPIYDSNVAYLPHHPYHYYQPEHDVYPAPSPYDYRHSPHHYIVEPHQSGTPTHTPIASGGHTPLQHHQSTMPYPIDIVDQRDTKQRRGSKIQSHRPIATTAVKSSSSAGNLGPSSSAASATPTALSESSYPVMRDYDVAGMRGSEGTTRKYYNTHPRAMDSQRHYSGFSQQSLRGAASSHEIVQNEISNNEHYIYVTYPPDLKKRYYDNYE